MEGILVVELNNEKNKVEGVDNKLDESFMEFIMESDRVDLTKEQLKTLRNANPRIIKAVADIRDHHVYVIGDPTLTGREASRHLNTMVKMFNLDWDRVTMTVNGRV